MAPCVSGSNVPESELPLAASPAPSFYAWASLSLVDLLGASTAMKFFMLAFLFRRSMAPSSVAMAVEARACVAQSFTAVAFVTRSAVAVAPSPGLLSSPSGASLVRPGLFAFAITSIHSRGHTCITQRLVTITVPRRQSDVCVTNSNSLLKACQNNQKLLLT